MAPDDPDKPPQKQAQVPPSEMTDEQLAEAYPSTPPALRRYLFPKGVSGNPGGMHKGTKNLASRLVNMLQADGGAIADAVAQKMLLKALLGEGDLGAMKEILNRESGPVTQKMEVVDYSKLAKTIRVVKVPPRGQPSEQEKEDDDGALDD